MKRVYILYLLFSLFLISCEQSSNDEPKGFTLIGKWKITSIEYYKNNTFDLEYSYFIKNTDYFEFKSNGTYEQVTDGDVESGPYTYVSDDNFTLDGYEGKIKRASDNNISLFVDVNDLDLVIKLAK